ncbi:MAG: hypothetical protein HUJ26_03945 [Planctomycetaceae bacterium]|nr:hypothetical protein [Planctomycetaceae bacterium]
MTLLMDSQTTEVLSVVCAVLMVVFLVFRRAAGGKYLDELISRSKSQKLIDRLTPPQITTHLWVTRVLDTAFPTCYGLWLASIILRSTGSDRLWFLLPIVLAVIADYLENWSHVTALKTKEVPRSKTIYSISKWVCLFLTIPLILFS